MVDKPVSFVFCCVAKGYETLGAAPNTLHVPPSPAPHTPLIPPPTPALARRTRPAPNPTYLKQPGDMVVFAAGMGLITFAMVKLGGGFWNMAHGTGKIE